MIYLLIPWVNNCILYVCTVYFKHKHPGRGSATASGQDSVATAIADVFQINCRFGMNKLHIIMRIFGDTAAPKNRGVI